MKLKGSQIKETREGLRLRQGCCALCGLALSAEDAVLDHDHKTGAIRAAIHRSCNSALGAIERVTRYGVKDVLSFAEGAALYLRLHAVDRTGLLHPTHRTAEEKKVRAKKRARKRRTLRVNQS